MYTLRRILDNIGGWTTKPRFWSSRIMSTWVILKLANQINLSYQFDPPIFTSKGFPRRFIICRAATTEIYINNNGDVYPCPLFKSYSEFYCGNILHDKWEEIWSADPMKIIREVSECCDCKYNCGVWCRALKYSMDGDLHGRSHYCLKEIQYVL